MKGDEIAKEMGVTGFARRRRFLAIDPPLYINCPFLRVFPAAECVIDIFPLSSDLGSLGTGFQFGEGRQACALRVH